MIRCQGGYRALFDSAGQQGVPERQERMSRTPGGFKRTEIPDTMK